MFYHLKCFIITEAHVVLIQGTPRCLNLFLAIYFNKLPDTRIFVKNLWRLFCKELVHKHLRAFWKAFSTWAFQLGGIITKLVLIHVQASFCHGFWWIRVVQLRYVPSLIHVIVGIIVTCNLVFIQFSTIPFFFRFHVPSHAWSRKRVQGWKKVQVPRYVPSLSYLLLGRCLHPTHSYLWRLFNE